MAVFFIILIAGILLQVLQYVLEVRFGKNGLLSVVKLIAYLSVGAAGFMLVLFNQHIFKEFEGYVSAVVLSLFLPRMIDFILGSVIETEDKTDQRHLLV